MITLDCLVDLSEEKQKVILNSIKSDLFKVAKIHDVIGPAVYLYSNSVVINDFKYKNDALGYLKSELDSLKILEDYILMVRVE